MIIQIVKFKTTLSEEELLAVAKERLPQFLSIRGLVQKYYVRGSGEDEYAGVYLWDSKESLETFRESGLAKSIPQAYKVVGNPVIDGGEVLFPLRD